MATLRKTRWHSTKLQKKKSIENLQLPFNEKLFMRILENPIDHPSRKLIIHDLMSMPKKPTHGYMGISNNTFRNTTKQSGIPLETSPEFRNTTMTSFVQHIQKLPSTNIITLNLENNLVKWREEKEKLDRQTKKKDIWLLLKLQP